MQRPDTARYLPSEEFAELSFRTCEWKTTLNRRHWRTNANELTYILAKFGRNFVQTYDNSSEFLPNSVQ